VYIDAKPFALAVLFFFFCFVRFLIAVCKVLFFVRISFFFFLFFHIDLHLMNMMKVFLTITFQTSKVGDGEIRL